MISRNKWFLFLLFGCIFVFILSMPMYFDQQTTSDNFLEEVWVNSFFRYGITGWSNMLFAFAPAFFPDMFFYFLSTFFLDNPLDKSYFTTLAQLGCYLFSIFYLISKTGIKRNVTLAELVFILVGLLCILTYSHYRGIMYYKTDDNFGSVILTLVSVGLVLEYLNTKKFFHLFLLSTVSFIAVVSNNLFLVTFTAPMALLASYQVFSTRSRVVWLKILLTTLGSGLLTKFALEPYIVPNASVNAKLNIHIPGITHAMQEFFISTKSLLLKGDFFTYLFFALYLAATLLNLGVFCTKIFRRNSTSEPYPVFVLLFYSLLLTPANLLAPLVLGSFSGGEWGYRYFATTVTVNLITALVLSYYLKRSLFSSRYIQSTLAAGMVVFLAYFLVYFESFKFLRPSTTIEEMRAPYAWSHEAALASCLDKNKQKYNLDTGVSDFWNSYPISIYSKKDINVVPVANSFRPAVNLDERLFFEKYKSGKPTHFNFLIVSNAESFSFTEENLLKKLPFSYDESFYCKTLGCEDDKCKIKVLVFKGDRFDHFIKEIAGKEHLYRAKKLEKINFTLSDWNSSLTGRVKNGVLTAEQGIDEAGYMNVGPQITLPAGKYKVWIDYKASSDKEADVLGVFEIWSHTVIHNNQITASNKIVHFEHEFEIVKPMPFAIATNYTGRGKLELIDAGIEKER